MRGRGRAGPSGGRGPRGRSTATRGTSWIGSSRSMAMAAMEDSGRVRRGREAKEHRIRRGSAPRGRIEAEASWTAAGKRRGDGGGLRRGSVMTGAKSGAALRRCSGEGRWRCEAPEAAGTKERRGGEPRAREGLRRASRALRRGAAKWAPSGQMARAGWLAAAAR